MMMTDRSTHPDDDDFARALEARHEQLLQGDSGEGRLDDQRVESAAEMLILLGEYRQANQVSELNRETNDAADASTPGSITVPEVAIYELQSLGRFEILEPIGRGGFGVVFRALDPDLRREVAVKVSRWDLASSNETYRRFQREAIAVAGLSHPGIVGVHEVDSDRGLDFIVSELVEGQSLAAALADGRKFSIRESVQIVRDIAEALEHAHQRGVLHRDLKPANILLPESAGGDQPRAKIADFGLAAVQGQSGLTQTGAMVGTPEYMSPEQAAGRTDQVQPATDVYGLGGILYCLLARRSPFSGSDLLQTLEAVKRTDPAPPSDWNGEVPRDLDAVCLKCLEKKPSQRYATARDLQADLNRFLDGVPVTARRITEVERVFRWCQRNPLMALLSILLLSGLVVGLATVGYLWQASERNYQTAERNQQKYVQKSQQLTSAIDGLFVSLAEHPEIRQSSADGLRRTLLEQAHRFQATFLEESPEDQDLQLEFARSMERLADIYSLLGDYRASHDLMKTAIELVEEQQPVLIQNQELMNWWIARAGMETHLGEFDNADQSFQHAMELSETGDESGTEDVDQADHLLHQVQVQIHHARSLIHQEKHQEAETEARQVQETLLEIEQAGNFLADPIEEPFHWNRGMCRFILAQASRMKGEFGQAIGLYEESLADLTLVAESTIESAGVKYDQANCLRGLGLAWAEQNQPEQAVDFYRRSLSLLDKLVSDHPQVEVFRHLQASVQYSLATNRMVSGKYNEFQLLIDDNIAAKNRLIDDFPDARAKYYSQLGDAYNLRYFGMAREGSSTRESLVDNLRAAKQAFDEALNLNPDWNRPKMAICRVVSNLGIEHAKQENAELAIEHFQEAIDRIRNVLHDQPDWAEAADQYYSSAVSLMFVLQQERDFDSAIDVASELVEQCPDHRRAFSVRVGLARMLASADRKNESIEYLATVCEPFARSWQDYGQAAETAIKLSQSPTPEGSGPDEDYRRLALEILKSGIEEHPDSRSEFLNWIESRPELSGFVEQLE